MNEKLRSKYFPTGNEPAPSSEWDEFSIAQIFCYYPHWVSDERKIKEDILYLGYYVPDTLSKMLFFALDNGYKRVGIPFTLVKKRNIFRKFYREGWKISEYLYKEDILVFEKKG